MAKSVKIDIRLEPEEALELERRARRAGIQKSQLARLLLTGGAQSIAQVASGQPVDDSRLSSIENRITEVEESLASSSRAFDALLNQLGEFLRVPSFREYRARLAAEGVAKRENEDDLAFLVRAASRYFVIFSVWPDPQNSAKFGPVPPGVNLEKFPKRPAV